MVQVAASSQQITAHAGLVLVRELAVALGLGELLERITVKKRQRGYRPSQQVLALCGQLAIEAAERDIPRDALASADELFLTSSTRGVQSLARLDGEAVGEGAPGPVALRLAGALRSLLES